VSAIPFTDYDRILKNIGASIGAFGFISSRSINNTTWLYGDSGACWLISLVGNEIRFSHCGQNGKEYVLQDSKTIKLPFIPSIDARILHVSSKKIEKNSFVNVFAIMESKKGRLHITLVEQREFVLIIPDVELKFERVVTRPDREVLDFSNEINKNMRVEVSFYPYLLETIPFDPNCIAYGGVNTILIFDKKTKSLYALSKEGNGFSTVIFSDLPMQSKSPVFEILDYSLFVMIDGFNIFLPSKNGNLKKIELLPIMKKVDMDPSNINYMLVKLKKGNHSHLFIHSPDSSKGLLLVSDPLSIHYGTLRLISLENGVE